jgi:exodeoxyribonuclease V alpha subunit
MVFLQGMGVSTSLAVRIYKAYGDAAIGVVRAEPYRLAAEVWGIGFKTADAIAAAVGIPHDSPQRVEAGLQFVLSEATEQGHCFLPEPDLVARAIEILQVPARLVVPCLAVLVAEQGVIREELPGADGELATVAIYLVPFHRAELSLAAGLRALAAADADRLPAFAAWTGPPRWPGCARAAAPSWRPSSRRRCGSR